MLLSRNLFGKEDEEDEEAREGEEAGEWVVTPQLNMAAG